MCSRIKHSEDLGSEQEIALASDTEGYHAHLDTKAEFGCVLFEKKELSSEDGNSMERLLPCNHANIIKDHHLDGTHDVICKECGRVIEKGIVSSAE